MSTLHVVPCGAAKLDRPAPAAQLYSSAHFQLTLAAARAAAGDDAGVRILSAQHGLVALDDVLAPYDVTMTDAGSVTTGELQDQLHELGVSADVSVITLLPKAYRARLTPAVLALGGRVVDLYADAPGIGYQRRVASQLLAAWS